MAPSTRWHWSLRQVLLIQALAALAFGIAVVNLPLALLCVLFFFPAAVRTCMFCLSATYLPSPHPFRDVLWIFWDSLIVMFLLWLETLEAFLMFEVFVGLPLLILGALEPTGYLALVLVIVGLLIALTAALLVWVGKLSRVWPVRHYRRNFATTEGPTL